mgnify:CR=1 FL=1
MLKFPSKITYTKKIVRKGYEYRNVILDPITFSKIVPGKLMKPEEWRLLGIEGSFGWEHYHHDSTKPQIIMMRKLIIKNPL